MSILEKTGNRTENWKTARCFAPLFSDKNLRLKLAQKLGEPEGTRPCQVHLQLFWFGMREHLHQTKKKKRDKLLSEDNTQDLVALYTRLFHDLRKKVEGFQSEKELKLKDLKDWNYDASTERGKSKLCNNLLRTEIDVVLETPNNLFIGEAKGETDFGGKGDRGLPHQLIRQYVMAKILVERLGSKKEVVSFVVRNEPKRREQAEIQFMVKQGWLPKGNILTWDCVKALTHDS